jgi:hypothetical protein
MQVYHSGRSSEVAEALYVEAKRKEPLAFSSWAQTRYSVRKLDAGDPHVRFDENLETEHSCTTAPDLDSTHRNKQRRAY